MENLYTGQGVGADEDGDDDEDEADGNVSRRISNFVCFVSAMVFESAHV